MFSSSIVPSTKNELQGSNIKGLQSCLMVKYAKPVGPNLVYTSIKANSNHSILRLRNTSNTISSSMKMDQLIK